MESSGEGRVEEMSEEEQKNIGAMFAQLGLKPKADSKEELQQWLKDFAASQDVKPKELASSTSSNVNQTVVNVLGRKPWLVKFSGEQGEGYDLWRFQLLSLIKEKHHDKDIFDAIRASLHGKAGAIVARLGAEASLDQIIKKMDSIFGEVGAEVDRLAAFFGARQQSKESVADWSCRLEKLLDEAAQQTELPDAPDKLLRKMLWSGLLPEMKSQTLYLYDTSTSFDSLRVSLRRIEKEGITANEKTKKVEKEAACKAAQVKESEISKLQSEMKELKETMKTIAMQISAPQAQGWNKTQGDQTQASRGGSSTGRGRNTGRGASSGTAQGPQCYRCGQFGHLQIGCRVRTDHIKKDFQTGFW